MDKRALDTLESLEKSACNDYGLFIRSADRYYASALDDSIPYSEMQDFLHDKAIKSYLDYRQEKIEKREEKERVRINRPIDEVIVEFNDPKSKIRVSTRMELRERFPGLSWQEQFKVLYAMLGTGTLTDLAWVAELCNGKYNLCLYMLRRLYPDEVNKFYDALHECSMKRLDNSKVANYVVGHSLPDVLRENFEALERTVGYRKVALRIARFDRDFVIDKTKLNVIQYLDICSQTHRPVKKAVLWHDFREWILGLKDYEVRWNRDVDFRPAESDGIPTLNLRLADIDEVRWLLKSCSRMYLSDVICAVYGLDCLINERMNKTLQEELAQNKVPISQYERDERYHRMLLQYAKEVISDYDPHLDIDITVFDKVRCHYDKMNLEEISSSEHTFRYKGETFRLVTNDTNNTLWFEKEPPETCSQLSVEELERTIDTITDHRDKQIIIETDNGTVKVRSKAVEIYHEGAPRVICSCTLRNFVTAYQKLLDKLIPK